MSSKIGINLMVWSGQIGTRALRLLPSIAAMGYDGVELPIFDATNVDVAKIRRTLSDSGLQCTVSTALPDGLNLIDPEVARRGVDWLSSIVLTAAALGSDIVCGPMATPVGELRGRGYTAAERACCVASLREVSAVANDVGVRLAFEALNRFETFFLNTIEDGVRLAQDVDNSAFGLLLDTFHMHIEEKSSADAVRNAADHLVHFHASENDRGIVGSGQVAWSQVFHALHDVQYSDWIVVESFNAVIPDLAGATCVWRPLAASPEELAQASLAFLRQNI